MLIKHTHFRERSDSPSIKRTTETGSRHYGVAAHTTRNPLFRAQPSGSLVKRTAERQFHASSSQEPPRNARCPATLTSSRPSLSE
jgi:hypothetical protein